MALFTPNLVCQVRTPNGKSAYGEETLGTPTLVPCAIIYLRNAIRESSVRADSSSSRGAAREKVIEAKLLTVASAAIKLDDQIEIAGYKLRVSSVFPRHDLNGVLDHYEIEATVWGKS